MPNISERIESFFIETFRVLALNILARHAKNHGRFLMVFWARGREMEKF